MIEECISEELYWLYEIVGEAKLLEILDMAGGTQVYIPQRKTIERPIRERAIVQEYNDGKNLIEIARKYDITTRQIRHIVNVNREATEKG